MIVKIVRVAALLAVVCLSLEIKAADRLSISWQRMPSGPLKNAVTVPGDKLISFHGQHGWAISRPRLADVSPDFIPTEDEGKLFVTEDGGQTWQLRSSLGSEKKGVIVYVSSLLQLNNEIGWIGGSKTVAEEPGHVYGDARAMLVSTIDGGLSWREGQIEAQKDKNLEVTRIESLSFVDQDRGWAVSRGKLRQDGAEVQVVLSTVDGGLHWTTQNVRDATGGQGRVQFVDASHGWAYAGRALLHTDDGGQHWVVQPAGLESRSNSLEAMYFLNASEGWLAEHRSPYLWHTVDGGGTWESMKLPDTLSVRVSIEGLIFTDARRGWVSGYSNKNGFVLETNDGGVHWVFEKLDDSGVIQFVVVPDAVMGLDADGDIWRRSLSAPVGSASAKYNAN